MAATFAPDWLDVADVKTWLRLQSQDVSDDALLNSVAAMAEPYVQRCRPEWWTAPAAPQPDLRDVPVSADTYSGEPEPPLGYPVALFGDWFFANPFAVAPVLNVTSTWTFVPKPGETAADLRSGALWVDASGGGGTLYPVQSLGGLPLAAQQAALWVQNYSVVPLTLRVVAGQPVFVWDGTSVPGNRYAPDAETYQGAVMYAAREYRRRNSPAGVEMFGDVTSFVSRFDPDIDRALQTGSYARPVVS